jgi:CRISPR/Cas system-associated exonuclease Cas4 (RecB family)
MKQNRVNSIDPVMSTRENVLIEHTTPSDWTGVLRITKSQLQTYILCPRKYYFQYVVGETPEFTPLNLVIGKAMHETVASFYRSMLVGGSKPSLDWLLTDWKMVWAMAQQDKTIQWETHTPESVYRQGQGMLTAFHENAAPRNIDAVEYPFAVPLHDPDTGLPTDFTLVGVIDLIESDEDGVRIVSELKTAGARMSDSKAESLLDGLIYAYALDQLGIRTTETETLVRIDVMVKTKTPGFQQVYVNKEAGDYRKLTRWIQQILGAIEAGSFFPVYGWACKGCQFKTACDAGMAL